MSQVAEVEREACILGVTLWEYVTSFFISLKNIPVATPVTIQWTHEQCPLVAMVAGMKIMRGVSNVDFHSPGLT